MPTNLQLDHWLIRKAMKLGRHRAKKAAVTQALTDYVRHLEQEKILSLFGKVDFERACDYKTQRVKL
jgi:Arc/MetJ family transcription regulator